MNTPKFYHFGWFGQMMQKGKRKHPGVLTVAYRVKESNLLIGFSFCSPQDNFSRKEGRNEALKIMRNCPIVVPMTVGSLIKNEVINVASALCGATNFIEGTVIPEAALLNFDEGVTTSRVPGWAKKWWKRFPDMMVRKNTEAGQSYKPCNPFLLPISELVRYAQEAGLKFKVSLD